MSKPAFETVFKENSSRLFNLAYRMMGDMEDAKDVVQDTFVIAYKHLDDFRSESDIYTWLYRICTNECLKQRKQKRLKFTELYDDNKINRMTDETRAWIENPENAVAMKELIAYIRRECHHIVLQKLSKPQRITFILRMILEMEYKEIADILEISENTVKARLNRARQNLLDHFETNCNWFKSYGEQSCCEQKLGYVLSLDIDLLNRVDETTKAYNTSVPEDRNIAFIDYIYRQLPSLQYNK